MKYTTTLTIHKDGTDKIVTKKIGWIEAHTIILMGKILSAMKLGQYTYID